MDDVNKLGIHARPAAQWIETREAAARLKSLES
jgi:phosphotransferase system HPr-like phosphotransfer protein